MLDRGDAIHALRSVPGFWHLGPRLLSDLLDWGLETERIQRRTVRNPTDTLDGTEVILVLDGGLEIESDDGLRVLGPGGTWRGPSSAAPRLRSRMGIETHCLLMRSDALQVAIRASPAILPPGSRPRFEAILVCEQEGLGAPLEALAQLLAASVETTSADTLVVTMHGDRVERKLWKPDEAAFVSLLGPTGRSTRDLRDVEDLAATIPTAPVARLFVVHPGAERGALAGWNFHRIVYLANDRPERIPEALLRTLHPAAVRGDQAYFTSFITSLVGDASPRKFRSERVVDDLDDPERGRWHDSGWRLRRDLCRVPFDLEWIASRWQDLQPCEQPGDPFARILFEESPATREIAARWGRAVTNRRVGVALSGGGASSYRLIPFLRGLVGVPVDVVSGVSAGALLGAYYCAQGPDGLKLYTRRGPTFMATALSSTLSSKVIRHQVERDLGTIAVEDLDVRFVALANALDGDRAPECRAIVSGTLGEAVQVSSSLPPAVAPTEIDGVRYFDGAAASPVPARVLWDYGADFVIACNSVAGPAKSNPLGSIPFGSTLHKLTPLGRLIDTWITAAFTMERFSREAKRDADVFYQTHPRNAPLIECLNFVGAESILRDAEQEGSLQGTLDECRERWQRFSTL